MTAIGSKHLTVCYQGYLVYLFKKCIIIIYILLCIDCAENNQSCLT